VKSLFFHLTSLLLSASTSVYFSTFSMVFGAARLDDMDSIQSTIFNGTVNNFFNSRTDLPPFNAPPHELLDRFWRWG